MNELDEPKEVSVYDKDQRQLTVQGPDGATMVYRMDPLGRLVELVGPGGKLWRYDWDDRGNHLRLTLPTGDSWLAELGNLSRPTRIEDPTGGYVKWWWSDPLTFNEADALGPRAQIKMDGLGRVVRITDGLGHATEYDHDANGNTVSVLRPDGSSVVMEYDPEGDLVRQTDGAGRAIKWDYDQFGNCVRNTIESRGGVSC